MKLKAIADKLLLNQTCLGDGGIAPIKIDLSSTDWTPPAGFTVGKISSTGGTVIFIDWEDNSDPDNVLFVENLPILAGANVPIINVKKIKKTGTDAENIVAWPLIF